MELGLSLGGDRDHGFSTSPKEQQQSHGIADIGLAMKKKKKNEIGFCMSLGIINSNGGMVLEEADKEQKSHESFDDGDDDDDDDGDDELEGDDADDDQTSEEDNIRENQTDDQKNKSSSNNNTPVQLDLLPLGPVLPRNSTPKGTLPWSSDNGSSENGSSGNVGPPVTRVFDMKRVPPPTGSLAEEVSSPNSVASAFRMDFLMYRGGNGGRLLGGGGGGGENGGGCKRSFEMVLSDAAAAEAERASSRASDEDENGVNTRKKLRLSKEQSAFLEESFKEHHTLNPKQKLALAKQLNLRPRQVEVWFQNRRARTKLKQTEVDCEYLKRCCETLTEENRRLHKELQELRALKTSNPFYMQLPATTLTMCPSCERVATTSSPAATTTSTAQVPTATTILPSSSNSTPPPTISLATSSTAPTDSTPKAIPFPMSRPRFYPFSHTTPSAHHPHQSAAS